MSNTELARGMDARHRVGARRSCSARHGRGGRRVVYEWNAERESDSAVLHRHAAWVSDLAWTTSSRGERLAYARPRLGDPHQPAFPTRHINSSLTRRYNGDGVEPPGVAVGHRWERLACPHLAAVGRYERALFADRARWGLVAQFRAHLGGVAALEWAPGGAELATAGWDRSVRRWRLQGVPEPSTQPDGSRPMSWCLMDTSWIRTSAVTALAWSPDGASLVGGDRRGKPVLWRCGDLSGTEFRPRTRV